MAPRPLPPSARRVLRPPVQGPFSPHRPFARSPFRLLRALDYRKKKTDERRGRWQVPPKSFTLSISGRSGTILLRPDLGLWKSNSMQSKRRVSMGSRVSLDRSTLKRQKNETYWWSDILRRARKRSL